MAETISTKTIDGCCKNEDMATSKVKRLPPCTFAIMVHRLYADRVRDAMLGGNKDNEWTSFLKFSCTDAQEGAEDGMVSRDLGTLRTQDYRVVPTQDEPGVRKARRGYTLLILQNCTSSLVDLSPLARQNISWGVPLSHEAKISKDLIKSLGGPLWGFLVKEAGFDISRDILRVDTYPKEESSSICLSLQTAASGSDPISESIPVVVDCYEGPISMTKSASKCTHILTVICIDQDTYVWGVMDHDYHASLTFNHNAAQKVRVEPTHPNSGVDLSNDKISSNVPVSRAYYKLTQVWDEMLKKENLVLKSNYGLDLGASPGGWTQVLRQHVGISMVISVDPGILAKRVSRLEGVQHVKADMASLQMANTIEAMSPQKCCMLVCDASLNSHLLLDKIVDLLKQLDKTIFACPAAFVITLKLPYKTQASLERNIHKVTQTIPSQLRRMAKLMYSHNVTIRYQIRHLMANSDSERTLVVVWHE